MFTYRIAFILLLAALITECKTSEKEENIVYLPKLQGEWWQIAGNPDLGECTSEEQQPVD